MIGTSLIIAVCLSSSVYTGCHAVPMSDFLPFGSSNGDSQLPHGLTGLAAIDYLPEWFVFYEERYKQLYVSVNGIVSLGNPVNESYNPNLFPSATPFISPFLANADTTEGAGNVWYGISLGNSVAAQIMAGKVAMYFDDADFTPKVVVTVTWDHVGYFPEKVDKVNTFQCVMATDGTMSYVMFLYLDNGINWYQTALTDDRDDKSVSVPAQVGFNKGCGMVDSFGSGEMVEGSGYVICNVFDVLNTSLTDDIVNIEEGSNINGAPPGLYLWKVSSNQIISGSLQKDENNNNEDIDSVALMISQGYGHQFGGTPLIISGPSFNPTDDIQCQFGLNRMVDGTVIDSEEALCISPMMNSTEVLSLELYINGVNVASTSFSIVPYHNGADVQSVDDELLIRSGDTVALNWSPTHLLPAAPAEDFTVNIVMYRLDSPQDDSPFHWSNATILFDVANSGVAAVDIPPTPPLPPITDPSNQSPYSLVMFKVVFVPMLSSSNKYTSVLSNIYFLDTSESVGVWSHVMFLVTRDDSDYCNEWSNSDSPFSPLPSGNCDNCVPSCPCNIMQATIPNSGFVSITMSPGMTKLNRYLRPEASSCFASIQSRLAEDYDPSQTCCYDTNGNLLVGLANGGHQSAVSPLSMTHPWSRHFLFDISPYIACCLPLSATCQLYYAKRPSDSCNNFSPWRPGWFIGDPHMITLDGRQYTFNGHGEFVLLNTYDDSLTIQGRMVPIATTDGGTVFTSIAVALDSGSNVVELRTNSTSNGTTIIVNGVHADLSVGLLHYYCNFTIHIADSTSITVMFINDGASLAVTQRQGYFSSISLSLTSSYANKTTGGLLGSYNNDPSDDLLPRNSASPLPPTATILDIHILFGLSWIVTDSSESLFTYDQSDSFSTYDNPNYFPSTDTIFMNPTLQAVAEAQCQGNELCLFDVAATGDIEVGLATLNETKKIDEIIQASKAVVCTPSCVHGACVDTNSCHCSYGYEGDICDTPQYTTCGNNTDNPCLNGATCSIHLFNYYCMCTASYTGQFCETADCGQPVSSSSLITISYDNTVAGSIATYSCPKGYRLTGDMYSECLGNSSWSLNRADCVIIDCGVPPLNNAHLSVSYESTVYASLSTYSCDSGFVLRGMGTQTCEDDGQWSSEQPQCLIDCGPPPNYGSGVMILYNETFEGSVAIYECEDNDHDLFGPDMITCRSNGTWNEEIAECRESAINSLLYIIIGSSVGGSIIIFLVIVLIVTCIGILLNKFKVTIEIEKRGMELTEI